jgi:hypothetical protein
MWHFIMLRENIFYISLKRKNILLIFERYWSVFIEMTLTKVNEVQVNVVGQNMHIRTKKQQINLFAMNLIIVGYDFQL